MVTTGRSVFVILLVQFVASFPPPPPSESVPPPAEHETRALASASVAAAAMTGVVFTVFPFGCWTSLSGAHDPRLAAFVSAGFGARPRRRNVVRFRVCNVVHSTL